MHELAYHRDPYRRTLDTEIVACGDDDGRFWAQTTDTIFYPEGGGQPADRGTLAGVRVVHVEAGDSAVRHYLEHGVEPGPAHLEIDWRRRFDHMQQHTGQHVLTAVAADVFGFSTTAFHLGEAISDIELDARRLEAGDLQRLEDLVNQAILAAHPVTPRWVGKGEYSKLDVRSRGLPEGHRGAVRLVEIVGVDLNTCGGTHLRSTAELGSLCLLGTEALRGGTRLFFVAGSRVRSRLGEHERRSARLRRALDAPNDKLVVEAERRGAEIGALMKRLRTLSGRLAKAEARTLASADDVVLAAHWQDADMAFLQTVASQLAKVRPDAVALLTAGADDQGVFLVLAGEHSGLDVAAIGGEIAGIVEGRGGGRGAIYQGKASQLGQRHEAAERLRNARK